MKVFPVRDQVVVVKKEEKEKLSPGGIITVSLSSSRSVEGKVIAVGSGRVTMSGAIVPLEVEIGDTVLFNQGQANEVQTDNGTVFLLREDSVVVLR